MVGDNRNSMMDRLSLPTPRPVATREPLSRDTIIDAAFALFLSGGHNAIGLRQIAKHLNTNLGRVQSYFRHKDDLVDAAIYKIFVEYSIAIEGIVKSSDTDALDRFIGIFDILFHYATDPEGAKRGIQMWSFALYEERVSIALSEAYLYIRDVLVNIAREMRPDISRPRARSIIIALMAQVEGLAIFCRPDTRMRLDVEGIREICLETWKNAFREQ